MDRSRNVREYVSLAFGGLADSAGSAIALAVLAHQVSAAELGRVALAHTTATVFFALGDPRLDDATIRFFPEIVQRRGEGEAHAFFRRMCRLDLVASVVLTGLFLALGGLGALRWTDAGFHLIAIAGLALGAQAAASAPVGLFSVTGGLAVYGQVRGVLGVVTVALQAAGAAMAGAAGYLWGLAGASAVSGVVLWVIAHRRAHHRLEPPRGRGRYEAAGVLRFTALSSLGSSFVGLADRLPALALGAVAPTAEVGLYRVGQAPGRVVLTLSSPVTAMQYPRLSEGAATGRSPELIRSYRKQSLRFLALGFPIALLAVPGLETLIPFVYGEGYRAAAWPAALILAGFTCRAAQPWSKVLCLAQGKPGLRTVVLSADMALTAMLTVVLGAKWNAAGAAAAFLASSVAICLVWDGIARRFARSGEGTLAGPPR